MEGIASEGTSCPGRWLHSSTAQSNSAAPAYVSLHLSELMGQLSTKLDLVAEPMCCKQICCWVQAALCKGSEMHARPDICERMRYGLAWQCCRVCALLSSSQSLACQWTSGRRHTRYAFAVPWKIQHCASRSGLWPFACWSCKGLSDAQAACAFSCH